MSRYKLKRKARRQYKKGDSFQYKQKTMESWPPQNYEYLVHDPDDWKNRSSLQSNIFESTLFQNWCIRKLDPQLVLQPCQC